MDQYHSGVAKMRNFFVDYRSGCSTRAGTRMVIQAFNSSLPVRIIPFQTSVLVPYILEFGDHYMRPISFGEPVLESQLTITSLGLTAPIVVTAPGNTYAIGDWVFISGTGVPQFDNLLYSVASVGSSFALNDIYGNATNGFPFTPWVSGGQVGRVYKIPSPYAATDLALLKFVQVANVMYLTHPSYPPQTLTFTGPTNWAFAPITFASTAQPPTITSVVPTSAGTTTFGYTITSVDANGEESIASNQVVQPNCVDIGSTAGSIAVNFTAPVGGAAGYNVYKAEPGVNTGVISSGAAFGFIGSTSADGVFIDSNIVPDFTQTPPNVQNPFISNNPGVCCFFQQRLYFAGSNALPQTFWGSQPGYYFNFNTSDPIQADDAITGTLVSLQVNFIKSMVPMPGGLILLTSGGAWQLSSGNGGLASTAAVTPVNATATPQAYNGISDVPPILINQDVLYVQYKNSIVRDLEYNIYANIYTGADISVVSNHLFFGHQILQWAYAEEPFKVVWCIREDGQALSLTYLKEQKITGWAQHDTQGAFLSVATVTEGNLDATYFVVRRKTSLGFFQFIERMDDRKLVYGAEDAWAVDCGSQTAQTYPNAGLFAAAATGTNVSFFATSPVFSPSSVGQVIRSGSGIGTITSYMNPMQVQVNITQPITAIVPNDPSRAPIGQNPGQWSVATPVTTIYGLNYLNGLSVSILADGNVLPQQVVTNGQIVLAQPASKVTVGLPFTAQLQTMPIDLGDVRDTIQGKRKKISALSIRMSQTRGLSYGQSFSLLTPIKEWSQGQFLGSTIPLVTGDERVIMDPLWNTPGQICIQQDNPLPATVLGVVPEVAIGDTPK